MVYTLFSLSGGFPCPMVEAVFSVSPHDFLQRRFALTFSDLRTSLRIAA